MILVKDVKRAARDTGSQRTGLSVDVREWGGVFLLEFIMFIREHYFMVSHPLYHNILIS